MAGTMIDVLIPAFNAEATVCEAVLSILDQSIRELRVIVVDDGSTDGTSALLADLAHAEPRLTIIRKENSGIVDALNLGLRHCHGEIVARHDADDIAFPQRFATQFAYLEAHPDCIAVGANAWHIDARGRRMGRTAVWGDAIGNWSIAPAAEPYLIHPFLMARRSSLEQVGGYRHVYNAEDSDLYWRLGELGRLHNLSDILGEYRMHGGSVTSASAVSARINAVDSQLAALSARRRSEGQQDLAFSAATLVRYRQAKDFSGILEIAAEQLTTVEAEWLHMAAAAKLLELRNYRSFKLSLADVATATAILSRSWNRLGRSERQNIVGYAVHNVRPKFGLKRMVARLMVAKQDRASSAPPRRAR